MAAEAVNSWDALGVIMASAVSWAEVERRFLLYCILGFVLGSNLSSSLTYKGNMCYTGLVISQQWSPNWWQFTVDRWVASSYWVLELWPWSPITTEVGWAENDGSIVRPTQSGYLLSSFYRDSILGICLSWCKAETITCALLTRRLHGARCFWVLSKYLSRKLLQDQIILVICVLRAETSTAFLLLTGEKIPEQTGLYLSESSRRSRN